MKFSFLDLVNYMALVADMFEEVEVMSQRNKQVIVLRESNLQRNVFESAEEAKKHLVEMFQQLKHNQLCLHEMAVKCKSLTQALTEVGVARFLRIISVRNVLLGWHYGFVFCKYSFTNGIIIEFTWI